MTYRYTELTRAADAQGRLRQAQTFEELAYYVQHARDSERSGKKDGAGICAPMRDGYRKNGNVLPRNWIALDIDGPHELDANGDPIKIKTEGGKEAIKPSIGISNQTIADICAALTGYEYFWHPSYSDKPEQNGRGRKIRVFLSLDKELESKQWEAAVKNLIARLEEQVPALAGTAALSSSIDSASARAAQFMFTCPKKKSGPAHFSQRRTVKDR